MRKNEIWPFAAMWMELEAIMLSERSQKKTGIVCFHSYVELEKLKTSGEGKEEKNSTNRGGGRQTIRDSFFFLIFFLTFIYF